MTVAPIRPGIEPVLDVAREMRDWASEQIKAHCADSTPESIVIVVLGRNVEGQHVHTVNSWTPADETTSRLQVCAAAAALLIHRATGA